MASGKDIVHCDWCGELNWYWNDMCWKCHKPLSQDMAEIIENQINEGDKYAPN